MATDKKTLLLVDGSSYLYRAFFAGGDAMNVTLPDGSVQKTGAIRIMINMLAKLRKDVHSDYAVCVFDAKGPTFRDALYADYKARRSPMPDDLRSQIEPIHEVVRLLGWKVVDVPGVEADDVIGTLACMASKQGIEVIISSGDKDMSQLVDENITVIDTMNDRRRDLAGVEAEFGVPPRLMVDYQTLVGDAVDNVPGVPKVGPKTAVKWLLEYGSLDALVARASEIKGVVGENLRASLDWLPQGRALLTIKKDCDLTAYIDGLPAMYSIAMGAENRESLIVFYEKYGFKGLVKQIAAGAPEVNVPSAGRKPKPAAKPDADSPGLFDEPALINVIHALADTPMVPMAQPAINLKYDTLFTWEAFDHWLAKNPSRRACGFRHRNHLARCNARRNCGLKL